MKQEGMTFDHDLCYFILLFSSLLKKEGREKENDVAKIVIKSHTFLFHPVKEIHKNGSQEPAGAGPFIRGSQSRELVKKEPDIQHWIIYNQEFNSFIRPSPFFYSTFLLFVLLIFLLFGFVLRLLTLITMASIAHYWSLIEYRVSKKTTTL